MTTFTIVDLGVGRRPMRVASNGDVLSSTATSFSDVTFMVFRGGQEHVLPRGARPVDLNANGQVVEWPSRDRLLVHDLDNGTVEDLGSLIAPHIPGSPSVWSGGITDAGVIAVCTSHAPYPGVLVDVAAKSATPLPSLPFPGVQLGTTMNAGGRLLAHAPAAGEWALYVYEGTAWRRLGAEDHLTMLMTSNDRPLTNDDVALALSPQGPTMVDVATGARTDVADLKAANATGTQVIYRQGLITEKLAWGGQSRSVIDLLWHAGPVPHEPTGRIVDLNDLGWFVVEGRPYGEAHPHGLLVTSDGAPPTVGPAGPLVNLDTVPDIPWVSGFVVRVIGGKFVVVPTDPPPDIQQALPADIEARLDRLAAGFDTAAANAGARLQREVGQLLFDALAEGGRS